MSDLLFPPPVPDDAPRTFVDFMEQGKYWVGVTGRYIPVDTMELGYVENTMALMRSHASTYAGRYTAPMYLYLLDAPDMAYHVVSREIDAIEADPVGWLKTTRLYRALKRRRKALRKGAREAARA